MIVYVSIGNSDDGLSQARWAEFVGAVDAILAVTALHGRWFSAPDVPWQSACWCVEFDPQTSVVDSVGMTKTKIAHIVDRLAQLCGAYQQHSIAWAPVHDPQFIRPEEVGPHAPHRGSARPAEDRDRPTP